MDPSLSNDPSLCNDVFAASPKNAEGLMARIKASKHPDNQKNLLNMTVLSRWVDRTPAKDAEALEAESKEKFSLLPNTVKERPLARLREKVLSAQVDAATADQTKDLRQKIEADSLLQVAAKQPLLARLREKVLSAQVDAATADQTKDLRQKIKADSLLQVAAKQPLLARLSQREIKVFGNYFTLIDELFVKDKAYNAAEKVKEEGEFDFYKSCCRDAYPPLLSQDQTREACAKKRNSEEVSRPAKRMMRCHTKSGVNDIYYLTHSQAQERSEAATNDGQSEQSSHASARLELWSTNVVGKPFASSTEIAHLVPPSPKDADSYWFVTDFLFGRDSTPRQWDETRRLIHGSNRPKGKRAEKVANTGIKHMVTNKILLASYQRDFLDQTPCVIIVPILRRNGDGEEVTALNWSGEAYDAIMLIDSYEDVEDDMSIPLSSVATATGYTHYDKAKENKAKSDEVQKAMDLFCDYTRAIYYAQDKLKPGDTEFSMEGQAGLFYPKLPYNYEHLNVRKISFASNDSRDGHPAPDPILLLSKSIAILQARHGFKMMALAEPTADVLPSDESIQAEEDFLRRREQAMIHQDPLGMDILVG